MFTLFSSSSSSAGDPSTENHARFNLSPVPSIGDDEDEHLHHQTRRNYPDIDQDDSGEEVDLNDGALGMTTTVTMFDHDHEVSSPSNDKYGNDQGKSTLLLKCISVYSFRMIIVTNVTYVVRKHYENFQTIDWLKDLMRNRIRHRNIRAQRRQSWRKRLYYWFDSWSGWICVLLVGVSAGKL